MTHSPYYYEGVRAAIAALPELKPTGQDAQLSPVWNHAIGKARDAIEALLPKPNVAKVLVEWYRQTFPNCDVVATHMDDEIAFAKWAVSEGLINIEKVGE